MNQLTTQMQVVPQTEIKKTQMTEKIALFNEAGDPITVNEAADIILAGYAIGSVGALSATDTLLEALGKLEARVVALETA